MRPTLKSKVLTAAIIAGAAVGASAPAASAAQVIEANAVKNGYLQLYGAYGSQCQVEWRVLSSVNAQIGQFLPYGTVQYTQQNGTGWVVAEPWQQRLHTESTYNGASAANEVRMRWRVTYGPCQIVYYRY